MTLNARWLETFTSLCEDGSLTRTAERIHMTQPGVSQHLRKLEEQVGTKLVLRVGKAFTLTPAGEKLREFGLARQRGEKRLLEEIRIDDPDAGDLSIACSGSFATLVYPMLLAYAAPRPDLVIRLEAAPQNRILDGVSVGTFDLGVLHADPRHPRLVAELVGREEICLIMPLENQDADFTFERLEACGFVGHPDAAGFADLLLAANFPDSFKGETAFGCAVTSIRSARFSRQLPSGWATRSCLAAPWTRFPTGTRSVSSPCRTRSIRISG